MSSPAASHAAAAVLPRRPVSVGWRRPGERWERADFEAPGPVSVTKAPLDHIEGLRITAALPDAEGLEVVFDAPGAFQALGGGERFEALDLHGQSVRYYLENAGLGSGTYLPSPWIATTLGFSIFLDAEAAAVFHIATPHDPDVLRVQVEGGRIDMEVHFGDLPELYSALVQRIGPPQMPGDAFFGLWKAGDWRVENAETVAQDVEGFAGLGLPMAVKLIDAYWEDEVHSFEFDTAKYPDAWNMVESLAAQGTRTWLWLCPWVVVGTKSFDLAKRSGFLVSDVSGRPLTRRPGANPNTQAALIDYSNPEARTWWTGHLRRLVDRGIAGFKADFGEQLPDDAVLASGETGGRGHNAFVRHYLQATAAAFDDRTPAIISRSGAPSVRLPIWSGDQTSDFCPKSGLPAAIRAAQSASLSGWSFVGSDLGGYFGTPTPEVFARWTQFACFTPLMMLHGLGCREPWQMGDASAEVFRRFARLHLALRPIFETYGTVAAAGGLPLIRPMPLAFPEQDWAGINDWDQQFLLGDDILVAPVAFYGNTRAVFLPSGSWFDALAGEWVTGPVWCCHDVPIDRVAVFVRAGACITLATDWSERRAVQIRFRPPTALMDGPEDQSASAWTIDRIGCPAGAAEPPDDQVPEWDHTGGIFGRIAWGPAVGSPEQAN